MYLFMRDLKKPYELNNDKNVIRFVGTNSEAQTVLKAG